MAVSKYCRICLIQNEVAMVSVLMTTKELQTQDMELFNHIRTNNTKNEIHWKSIENLTIQKMITACSPQTEFGADKLLPKRICKECIHDLVPAYLFRLRCENAINNLKVLLNGKKQKKNNPVSICTDTAILPESTDDAHHFQEVFVKTEDCNNRSTSDNQACGISTKIEIDIENGDDIDEDKADEVFEVFDDSIKVEDDFMHVTNNETESRQDYECGYCSQLLTNYSEHTMHMSVHRATENACHNTESTVNFNSEPLAQFEKKNENDLNDDNDRSASSEVLNYEWITGLRSDSNLIHVIDEDQLYCINTNTSNSKIFKCRVRSCRSRVYLDVGNMCRRVRNFQHHNHGDSESFIEELKVRNKIKIACATPSSDRQKTIKEIFEDIIKQHPTMRKKIKYKSIERNLRLHYYRNDTAINVTQGKIPQIHSKSE